MIFLNVDKNKLNNFQLLKNKVIIKILTRFNLKSSLNPKQF
jgi:hypothetical protein